MKGEGGEEGGKGRVYEGEEECRGGVYEGEERGKGDKLT